MEKQNGKSHNSAKFDFDMYDKDVDEYDMRPTRVHDLPALSYRRNLIAVVILS